MSLLSRDMTVLGTNSNCLPEIMTMTTSRRGQNIGSAYKFSERKQVWKEWREARYKRNSALDKPVRKQVWKEWREARYKRNSALDKPVEVSFVDINSAVISKPGVRAKFCNGACKLRTIMCEAVFNDPIHGHIELPPQCVKIVDTPQFQRLRNIKQIGTCYYVYPGASHNRFEHSLGVCFLAGKLLKAITEKQSDLVTAKDILCVQIAGLCHDLGQGPFSHLFEKRFIPILHQGREWQHEEASVKMFDYMLNEKVEDDRTLRQDFDASIEGFEEKDIIFIREMIKPPPARGQGVWPYEGREKEKGFLYQVVSNKLTGIDVDRWDYLARDSYMLGMKNIFDHNRCISASRVLTEVDGSTHICFRDKEAQDIYDMFYTRMTLHRRAYQHKTTNIIGRMICEALQLANDNLTFEGKDGKMFTLANTIDDMEAYSKVTDDVLYTIIQSSDTKLNASRDILNLIMTRKLYKCVGQTQVKHDQDRKLDEADFKEALLKKIKEKQPHSTAVFENSIEIDVVNLNYGMEDKDPIKNVKFYSKFNENEPLNISKDQVSYVLPDTFSEQIVRVYYKSPSANGNTIIVKDSFKEWCEDKGYPKPKDR